MRLDVFLSEKGLCESRQRAKLLIESGLVMQNGKVVKKPAAQAADTDSIEIVGEALPYVGRGALKLEKAFETFGLDATGQTALDVGASTGGFDIIALLLTKKFSFPMGTISYAFNALVTGALAFVNGLDVAALSMVVLFVSSMAFNNVLQGMNRTKTLFIISDRWEEIAPHVLEEVHRGVTLIPAKGAYTGREKTLVYVIARTTELSAIRHIVLELDPAAMISIIDTREVVGRGFTPNN